jgi:hypothetical protein
VRYQFGTYDVFAPLKSLLHPVVQAMTLYEESIADQRQRTTALQSIVGALAGCAVFGPENRDALVQNAAG